MSRTFVLSALLALAATSAAAAECVKVISDLEERMVALDGREQAVEIRTRTERVEVEQPPGGVQPTESWGGASSGLAKAREQLRTARFLAQDGDEDGCLVLTEQTLVIVESLER